MVATQVFGVAGLVAAPVNDSLIHDSAPLLGDTRHPQGRRFVFLGNYIGGNGQDVAIRAFQRIPAWWRACEVVANRAPFVLRKLC